MRWQMGRRSDNIEDRRGMPVGRGAAVGGGIGTLVLVLLAMYFGVDPSVILQGTDPGDSRPAPSVQQRPGGDDQLRDFVSVVLADTEDTWRELFKQMGRQYQEPKLVLFSGAVQSACGFAQAAVGPFYCPGDKKVYIDLSFYRDLRERQILEAGDIEEGLNAASAIGDDRLQRQSQGRVVPESFTHGSSAQRVRWFKRGIETGDPGQCDTFTAAKL